MILNLTYLKKGAVIPLDPPTDLYASASNASVSLMWTDPSDKYATPSGESTGQDDQLVSQWAYTKIIRKTGSQPISPNDGEPVIEVAVKNQYASTPYVDSNVQNDVTYYYAAYAYNTDGVASEAAFFNAVTPKQFDPILENNTWAEIRSASDAGLASSSWEIGDTKTIHIQGTVGTENLNKDFCVFIIGFNHNSLVEGGGITFQGFKTIDYNKDVSLVSMSCGNFSQDSGDFVMNTVDSNSGGWASSDMRLNCLGSDDALTPRENTLMDAIPSDLRNNMKAMTIWTNNNSGTTNVASSSIDYLPLMSEYEIFGSATYSCAAETEYQQQYTYYYSGNSTIKYRYDLEESATTWWQRSPRKESSGNFCSVNSSGRANNRGASLSAGVSPIFRI